MPSYENNTFDNIVYRNSTYYGTAEYLKSKVNNNSWEPVKGEDFINSVNESVIWWNRMTTQPTSTDIVTISAAISPIVGFWGEPYHEQDPKGYKIHLYSDDEDNFRIYFIQDYVWAPDNADMATLRYRRIFADSASINRKFEDFPIKIYLTHYANSHSYWRYSGVMSLTRQVGNNIKTYTAYKTSDILATIDGYVSLNELNLNQSIFSLNRTMGHLTIFHTLSNTTSTIFTATASITDTFRL